MLTSCSVLTPPNRTNTFFTSPSIPKTYILKPPMSLLLGLLIFSFIITSIAIVPFIDLLYRIRFYKSKSAILSGNKTAASEHIKSKARTPEGGGLLILVIVSLLFAFIFPLIKFLGVYITQVYPLQHELNVIFFTLISFGLL